MSFSFPSHMWKGTFLSNDLPPFKIQIIKIEVSSDEKSMLIVIFDESIDYPPSLTRYVY